MDLYTAEHKTSMTGLRREQFLPLVIPSEGCSWRLAGNFHRTMSQPWYRLGKGAIWATPPGAQTGGRLVHEAVEHQWGSGMAQETFGWVQRGECHQSALNESDVGESWVPWKPCLFCPAQERSAQGRLKNKTQQTGTLKQSGETGLCQILNLTVLLNHFPKWHTWCFVCCILHLKSGDEVGGLHRKYFCDFSHSFWPTQMPLRVTHPQNIWGKHMDPSNGWDLLEIIQP